MTEDLQRERWQEIAAILERAFDLAERERATFVERACGDDRALRAEIEALLAADRRGNRLLDSGLETVAASLFRGVAAGSFRTTPPELSPGTRLGSYEILGQLGAGGMGEVYRARDLRLEREVAVKVLREDLALDPTRLERFEGEARAASALNHPNILVIHGIGEEGDARYIVMEYVEGETLRRVLASGPLPVGRLFRLAAQIASGLEKAHAAGIVHRDLKPENVMISTDGFAKIVDFGLSKLVPTRAGGRADGSWATADGTEPSRLVGTLAYMSPEQAAGRSVDFRSDQFSLGTVLFEMATGRKAFRRETPEETLAAIRESDPEPPLGADLPPRFRGLVERCLAKRREERFDSTADLARDLRSLDRRPYDPFRDRRSAGAEAGLERATVGERVDSLAILPLVDLDGDPGREYFADGMTEALIDRLARIGGLRVISRGSVMRFKNTETPVTEIAGRLGVAGVLEGTVRRIGDRVRIAVDLLHGPTGRPLWARSYDRVLDDMPALQAELARAIVREIRLRVAPAERARLDASPAVPPDAQESYLLGRYLLNRRTTDALEKSVGYFERAIERAPDYALAYSGLADALALLAGAGHLVAGTGLEERARAAARRALELDEWLAEAHLSLAFLRFKVDWDWPGAEIEFRRAVELAPGSASAHHWYALFLSARSRHEEAEAHIVEALKLDPLSLIIRVAASRVAQFARDFDRAIERCEAALDLEPDYAEGHFNMGMCLLQEERSAEAAESLERAVALGGRRPLFMGVLAVALARSGRERDARRLVAELEELDGGSTSAALVAAHVGLGEPERAVGHAIAAAERREGPVAFFGVEPLTDELRGIPEFENLLRRVGLLRSESRP